MHSFDESNLFLFDVSLSLILLLSPHTSHTCLQFFRSVQSTCTELLKVIERYQQRITRESLRASLPQSSRTS